VDSGLLRGVLALALGLHAPTSTPASARAASNRPALNRLVVPRWFSRRCAS
jgi:hypothetical protein